MNLFTVKCPHCPWERGHVFADTARRMRDTHIKKEHPDKEHS